MPKAYGGNQEVNPVLDSASSVISKINGFIMAGNKHYTVGIATCAICEAAGDLWKKNTPSGTTRSYLKPVEKAVVNGVKRGYQANYQQKNNGTAWNANTSLNFHVSCSDKPK